jgi:hypothetical protein
VRLLLKLWCVDATRFSRQREHVAFQPAVAEVEDLEDADQVLHAMCPALPQERPKTDVELDIIDARLPNVGAATDRGRGRGFGVGRPGTKVRGRQGGSGPKAGGGKGRGRGGRRAGRRRGRGGEAVEASVAVMTDGDAEEQAGSSSSGSAADCARSPDEQGLDSSDSVVSSSSSGSTSD